MSTKIESKEELKAKMAKKRKDMKSNRGLSGSMSGLSKNCVDRNVTNLLSNQNNSHPNLYKDILNNKQREYIMSFNKEYFE